MLVTKELLKKFARYEISGRELFEEEFYIEDEYKATLDDFKAVIKKLEEMKDEDFATFENEWFQYVYYGKEINSALGIDGYSNEDWKLKEGLIKTDEDMISYIMHVFAEGSDDYFLEEETLSAEKVIDLDKLKKVINDYESNKTKPLTEWEYPDDIKESFVKYMDDQDGHPERVSEDEIVLFKRYLDELIVKDNVAALHIKGYLCYGGSTFFDCDWCISRDCITRAFELTGDPVYANTLGYIYYYGRCNNGEPEYEKAFKYYTYGYANNWYESSYKLADMYKGGKGTFKSEETAASIIENLYDYAVKDLCKGDDKKFADVALRMGSIRENDDEREAAYYYYLQADYAIKRRDYYGDSVVRKGIKEGLERTRPEYRLNAEKKTARSDQRLLNIPLSNDYVCCGFVKNLKKGYSITIKRMPKRSEQEPELVFITLLDYDFCTLTDHITIHFDGEWNKELLPETFIFDDYDFTRAKEDDFAVIYFTLFGVPVAQITSEYSYKLRIRSTIN